MNESPKFDALILDLDGTLVNSIGDIAAAMNRALAAFGRAPHPVESYNLMVGDGIRMLALRAAGMDAAFAEVLLPRYDAEYKAHMFDTTRPYAGLPEALRTIRARGVRLAVFSNKPDADARRVVETVYPAFPFELVRGQLPDVPTKPAPDGALRAAADLGVPPARCAFAGDSGMDMRCARAAGMTACGVTWGFRTREELLACGADHLVDTPEALAALF